MKRLMAIATALLLLSVPAKAQFGTFGYNPFGNYQKPTFGASSVSSLSEVEKEDLLYMREEEKLARDVYLTLSKYYPQYPIFKNIARSEERHMEAVGALIEKYGLRDPVRETGGRIGIFKNPKLYKLYLELVEEGKRSFKDALRVGIKIEKLDIKDLKEAIARTDKPDIRTVYRRLLRGSQNHLRAFTKLLNGASPSEVEIESGDYYYDEEVAPAYEAPRPVKKVIKGRISRILKEPSVRKRRVEWWILVVDTPYGYARVRLAPVWQFPRLPFRRGDRVEIFAFKPPYWESMGIDEFVACRVSDIDSGEEIDLSRWRCFCNR